MNLPSFAFYTPMCASCKKIRNDQGYWQQVDHYISEYAGVDITHGICPDCLKTLYPEYCGTEDQSNPLKAETQT